MRLLHSALLGAWSLELGTGNFDQESSGGDSGGHVLRETTSKPVPEEQYQERFWRRRLDGIGLDMIKKELLTIEIKRTRDARSNYVEKAIAVAQEQYTSLLTGLQAVGQVKGWKCLSSAKLRSTDSVNPRAVLSRVRPRYRHLLQTP
jgi:hypothetical protein